MLIAPTKAGEPQWVKVMGAQVLFAPIDRGMLRRARRAAMQALGRDDGQADRDAEHGSAVDQMEELGDALSHALIMEGARDWRDVARQLVDDDGEPLLDGEHRPQFEPLPFTAANLADTLSDPIVFEAFDAAYVMPFAAREREKNASAASPTGTGEGATPANATASSRARPKPQAAAKRARTASKRQKPMKARKSGTS